MTHLRPLLLRLFRAAVVVVLVALIHDQWRWRVARQEPAVNLSRVREFFPDASRVGPRDSERGAHLVFDRRGDTLGAVLRTSPDTDDILGYSGPNDLLVALDLEGSIVGVDLLRSGDTPEHVERVRQEAGFLSSFAGWNPARDPAPAVTAVSGATLTSLAIVEAVQRRLSGAAPSLRFPEPLTLADVRGLFTNAMSFEREDTRFAVRDESQVLLGYAVRTSPQADNVSGYSGPTEALVALSTNGRTITDIRVLKSYDTPSYVEQVERDRYYLGLFKGRSLEAMAQLDFAAEGIEGVSGATRTGWALAEGMKRKFAAELRGRAERNSWRPRPHDWALAGVVTGALLMAFTPLRGRRWARGIWQAVLIGYVGWISGDLLSLSLLGGWAAHGLAWRSAVGLALLAGAALLIPWLTRRQIYCHQLCPHGAAQQVLGKLSRRRWTLPAPASRWLEKLPVLLLAVALTILLLGWSLPLANLEPFDAWVWPASGLATLVIAGVGLIASLFVPQAYCRYGCPTGALLNFVRAAGSGDRWGRRDWMGLGFVGLAMLLVACVRAFNPPPPAPDALALHGKTMGTTWTVKIRDDVQDPERLQAEIATEFDWADSMTSHWNTHTDLSEFNMAYTTNPVAVPWPVVKLAKLSADISAATDGAYDITVGPLVRLWGFGPAPRRDRPPDDEDIARKRSEMGWRKLQVLEGQLRKVEPALEIDLSAIAPGWAVDEITRLLDYKGYREYLVESGGELRARGQWTVAIEHPDRPVILRDEALGTSGTYRQKWTFEGKEYSHLIDPRTGRPVTHRTVSVSVRHEDCARADAWAAALNILGIEDGLPLANRLGLAAQFVVESTEGQLEVRESGPWKNRAKEPRPPSR